MDAPEPLADDDVEIAEVGRNAGIEVDDLGVDAVWLSPFFTSPQNDAGYDVADVTYAVLTYEDGSIVNLGVSYALPEKYPALGHSARVEVLGTGGGSGTRSSNSGGM